MKTIGTIAMLVGLLCLFGGCELITGAIDETRAQIGLATCAGGLVLLVLGSAALSRALAGRRR